MTQTTERERAVAILQDREVRQAVQPEVGLLDYLNRIHQTTIEHGALSFPTSTWGHMMRDAEAAMALVQDGTAVSGPAVDERQVAKLHMYTVIWWTVPNCHLPNFIQTRGTIAIITISEESAAFMAGEIVKTQHPELLQTDGSEHNNGPLVSICCKALQVPDQMVINLAQHLKANQS